MIYSTTKYRHHFVKLTLTAIAFISSIATGFSQQQSLDTLLHQFDVFRKSTLQEKIYVHTDRGSYLTGETLWFKVYLTDGSIHKPLGLSKVVYLEIVDRQNNPVLQTKIRMKDGIGFGSLYLPPTLSSENYTLRAYTNWMKNFASDFFFNKPVFIVNTFRRIEPPEISSAPSNDVQFFPEGGNLIVGLESKVAFRATDPNGKGISFSGTITNRQNETVASFEPHKFGIGHFAFTPKLNEEYHAKIRDGSGRISTYSFPVALPEGFTLTLIDSSDQFLYVKVLSNLKNSNSQEAVYLFVHARNIVTKTAFQFLQQGHTIFKVDKNELLEGTSHFTLFDSQLHPVCERLYFKKPRPQLNISILSNQPVYPTRSLVQLNVQAINGSNKPSLSNLSASVYRLDSLPHHDQNINDYYLLTSDLKGLVESPHYYLKETSLEAKIATDNLMLTHGWRRFHWDTILKGEEPVIKFIPEYRGHIINGMVKATNGTPASGIVSYLSSPDKDVRLYCARSNSGGEVIFEMQQFVGSSRIIAQMNFKKDSAYQIEITSPFSAQPAAIHPESFKLSKDISEQLLQRSVAMQVQDIYYEEKLEALAQQDSDSTTFYGPADENYYLDDYTRFPVMEEVMREYVPGVLVRARKDGFHFKVLDNVNKKVFEDTPLILLDGIPIFDEDEIMKFDPLKVKKLEVMTRRYYLGPISFPGVVSYRTYGGDLAGFELNPRSVTVNYDGLQRQREFYSPRYENNNQRESRMPDQRSLLYWNPLVITGSDGKQHLEFYTSDLPGKYKIVVEGITPDGEVGVGSTTIEVNSSANN